MKIKGVKRANSKTILLVLIVSLFLTPSVVSAACSLGATPLSASARAFPGQTVIATWNFYNLYGDMITHVKIIAPEVEPGWEITFEPELASVTYNVTGVIQTIEENVALPLMPVVTDKPEFIEEGIDYVKHPKEEGYIPVKPVKIYIKVPENVELWKDYNFVFEARGSCFMEPGAAVPSAALQFNLNIKTTSPERFEEVVIEEIPPTEAVEEEKPTTFEVITGFFIANSPWIGIIVVLIILLAYFGFIRKREFRHKRK